MSVLLYIVIFSIFVSSVDSDDGERWAVLVAGSQGWKNYRHQVNVCRAYQILRKGGLKEENIIVFMYDDIAYNIKNPTKGKIVYKEKGRDVYRGVPKDYTGKYATSHNFYNVLHGVRNLNDENNEMKVLKSGPNDHIFIYYTGHGARNVLAMPPKGDYVYRDDFLSVLNYMHHAGLYKQMVVIVESCYSGSMFEGAMGLDDMNIFITTSAKTSEICYACSYSCKYETSLGTTFSAAWMKDSETHNLQKTTLNQQYERVKKKVAKDSTVMKYGSKRVGEKHVSEFFQKPCSRRFSFWKMRFVCT